MKKKNKNNEEILLQRVSDHYEVREHDITTNKEKELGVCKSFDEAFQLADKMQREISPRYGLRIVVNSI